MGTAEWLASVNWVDVIITSGFLGTMAGTYLKWRNDRKKAPLDRESILSAASEQNVTSALAISAEARATAEATRQQYIEDTDRIEARHSREMASLLARLDSLEQANVALTAEVHRLTQGQQQKAEELFSLHGRIGKLEKNLGAAKDTVVSLVEHIKLHTPDTIPEVDYTIFDHHHH